MINKKKCIHYNIGYNYLNGIIIHIISSSSTVHRILQSDVVGRIRRIFHTISQYLRTASTSPSSTIHLGCSFSTRPKSRNVEEKRPSFHSRVMGCKHPYKASVEITLGLISTARTRLSGL